MFNHQNNAFTVLELLIVISVLVILIGIGIPRIKGMQLAAQQVQVLRELRTVEAALRSYYINANPSAYPPSTTTLQNSYLINAVPQFLSSVIYDAYNPDGSSEFNYIRSANRKYYVISSVGPNGVANACFIAGTKVLLANGNYEFIESITVGDKVLGSNNMVNKVLNIKEITKTNVKIYSINGSRYFVTDNHLFKTTKGWAAINQKAAQRLYPQLKVRKLRVGDSLLLLDGENLIINKINAKFFHRIKVYDLELNGNHEFYADNFLVHNAGGPVLAIAATGAVTISGDDICVTNGSGC